MGREKVIMSRVMNDKFVLVLYKHLGEPATMNIRIYINKVNVLENRLENIIKECNGELDYFADCNGNNDFFI